MWMSAESRAGSRICEESAHMGMWLTEVLFELGSEGGVGFHQMEKELKDIVCKIQVYKRT